VGAYTRKHMRLFQYEDENGHIKYRREWIGWMRAEGINPKRTGTNPRANGTNKRALGTNPRAKKK